MHARMPCPSAGDVDKIRTKPGGGAVAVVVNTVVTTNKYDYIQPDHTILERMLN